jgi:hypothetical protein
MTRPCTICTHKDRPAIDKALVAGGPAEGVARRYPPLSATAIRRHKAEHVHLALLQARDVAEVARGDDLLGQVRDLHARALAILGTAEGAGELRAALGAIREARGCIELLAKLLGELQDGSTTNILVSSPEWQRVQVVIAEALRPYPEARAAVTERLLALEASNG